MVAVALVGCRNGVNVVPLARVIGLGSAVILVAVVEVGPGPEPTVTTSTVFAFEKGIVMTVGTFLATPAGELIGAGVVFETNGSTLPLTIRTEAFESLAECVCNTWGDDLAGIT